MRQDYRSDSALESLRQSIRTEKFSDKTSGLMSGLVQGNLVILPELYAREFLEFCRLNPKQCPVIGYSEPGNPTIPTLGKDLDIRVDVPEYHVFENGDFSKAVYNINDLWQEDSVAIVMGCSFSFEDALQADGYLIRNIVYGANVSMYDTNIPTQSTEHFSCNTVVSMRPFKKEDIEEVINITSRYPKAHGSPIHCGDPSEIGISDINSPDYGDPVPMADDDITLFWGCGVTSQRAVRSAKLPLVITHAPGKMLITDLSYDQLTSDS